MTPKPTPFALQLARIEAKLKSKPSHAKGRKKPSLTQLESTPPKKRP